MREKITVLIILIILAITGSFLYDYNSTPSVKTPETVIISKHKQFPAVNFINFNGKKFSINDIQTPTILLNFWATWCSTCVAEMPNMLKLAQKMNGKIAIIFLSIDENQQLAENFKNKLEKQGLNTSKNIYWAWDKNKEISLNKFNILKTPETIIINKNRQMVDKVVGKYDWLNFSQHNMFKK